MRAEAPIRDPGPVLPVGNGYSSGMYISLGFISAPVPAR